MWRASADSRHVQLHAAFAQAPEHTSPPHPPHTNRASFEVPDDIEALRLRLGSLPKALQRPAPSTAPLAGPPPVPLAARHPDHEAERAYEQWRAQHPPVLQHMDDVRQLLSGKRLAVFLDYDGTLTPIVSNPDEALLSQQMRDVVRSVARLFPTAIISGRGREKVENFVQLKELYYAGSHGMDIAGPTALPETGGAAGSDAAFQPAAHFKPLIDNVYRELCERLASIPGASVEHNTFCVSAHFRNCSAERWQDVVVAVEQVVAQNPELRMTRGRKVVEVRPKVNWHKGTALEHLLGVLGLKSCGDVVALYIGDDHTDEDAFRVLRDTRQGFGVLVSTKVRDTAAMYTARDPAEVQQFLQALVSWGMTPENGWAEFLGLTRSPGRAGSSSCTHGSAASGVAVPVGAANGHHGGPQGGPVLSSTSTTTTGVVQGTGSTGTSRPPGLPPLPPSPAAHKSQSHALTARTSS